MLNFHPRVVFLCTNFLRWPNSIWAAMFVLWLTQPCHWNFEVCFTFTPILTPRILTANTVEYPRIPKIPKSTDVQRKKQKLTPSAKEQFETISLCETLSDDAVGSCISRLLNSYTLWINSLPCAEFSTQIRAGALYPRSEFSNYRTQIGNTNMAGPTGRIIS